LISLKEKFSFSSAQPSHAQFPGLSIVKVCLNYFVITKTCYVSLISLPSSLLDIEWKRNNPTVITDRTVGPIRNMHSLPSCGIASSFAFRTSHLAGMRTRMRSDPRDQCSPVSDLIASMPWLRRQNDEQLSWAVPFPQCVGIGLSV